jgi:TetR/AcrR family transcriptional repressor of nem operon
MSKGDQTRQRIIAEAASMFNRRGFEGGSLLDLMEATGLEKGGIYRHFSSKEELAAAAFDYAWNQASAARRQEVDSIENNADKLLRMIRNFVERRAPVPGGCPLLNTSVDADDGNPVLRDRARKALKEWQGRLGKVIDDGIHLGHIRPNVNRDKLANLIIASLEGALMISRLERDDRALRDAQAHLSDYIEAQVRSQGKRKRSKAQSHARAEAISS